MREAQFRPEELTQKAREKIRYDENGNLYDSSDEEAVLTRPVELHVVMKALIGPPAVEKLGYWIVPSEASAEQSIPDLWRHRFRTRNAAEHQLEMF